MSYEAFFFARNFAQRFFCAALMFASALADSLRRLRVGLVPAYTPAKAASAAFKPESWAILAGLRNLGNGTNGQQTT